MKKFIFNKQQIIKCIAIPIVLFILQLGISSNNAGAGGNSVNGCSCHGAQSSLTLITLSGIPTGGYVLGQIYTLTATVTNSAKTKAGFDIAVNAGSITAGTGTTVSGLDITHNGGKLMTSGAASWTFQWTAPATGSSVTFNFAGNATDNNGGTGGDAWVKQPFTFTAAPVITVPTITSITTTGITTSTANGSANVNANGASTAITIEYGTTTSYGSATAATPNTATGTTATPTTYAFTGLLPATVYHYRIKTVNSAGTTYSPDQIFTTLSAVAAPTITSITTTGITSSSANGSASVNAGGASTAITIEYGTTTSYGSVTAATPNTATGTTATPITYAFTGLLSATMYHYRIKTVNSAGTTYSSDQVFTTLIAVAIPTITNIITNNITTTSANGSADVNANGASTAITIEYGTTTSYGSTTAATPNTATGTTATPITYAFTGLIPATMYHYRIKTVNSAGTTYSPDQIFTTLTAVAVPTITNINTTNITFNSATGSADVNANLGSTTVTVEYGITTSYGSSTTAAPSTVTGSTNTPITFPFTGLTQNTQYHYRIKAVNSAGTTTSADQKFTTIGSALNDVNKIECSIYPNPCAEQLTIKVENCQQYSIKLVAVNGTEIAINPVKSANSILIQTAAIANGNYILSLHSKLNTYSYPVVIKH